jgi:cob(I)alamin adenosyltransferase
MRRDAADRVGAGLAHVKELAVGGDIDLLVLDEASHIINLGLASAADVSEILKSMPEGSDVILTGRDMPEELIEQADLVTEMRNVRHPFDGGEPARFGIEY